MWLWTALCLWVAPGCFTPGTDSTFHETIVDNGIRYDLRARLGLGAGDGAWAARVDVPESGAKLIFKVDATIRPGPDGAALVAVLDGNQLKAQGNFFRCVADDSGTHTEYVLFPELKGPATLLFIWVGVTVNATAKVYVPAGVGITDLGQAEQHAVAFQPRTMGDSSPALHSGSFNQRLSGPTLFWGDFFVDRFASGDVAVTAGGASHSGHVDSNLLPTITSYAGIWNATDFSVSYRTAGVDPQSGLYGALVTLPAGVPTPGWLEAIAGWCVPNPAG